MAEVGKTISRRIPLTKYSSLLPGWDQEWNKAKRDCATTPKGILLLGDSYATGGSATDWGTLGFPALLKAKLVADGFAWGGDFWHVGISDSWDSSLVGDATARPWVFTTAPTWALGGGYGLYPSYTNANVGAMTFTTPYACTAFDILSIETVAGTYSYTIDGGGAQTVTTTALNFHRKISVTGLANTTHTIVFGANQSATNVKQVLGITTYASTTAGLLFARLVYSGAALAHYGWRAGAVPNDRLKIFQGNTTEAGTNVGFGFPMQPALCIMNLCLNDCQGFIGEDAYLSFLRRLCQALRRGYADCSILMLVSSFPDGVSSDVTPGLTNPQNYLSYVEGMKQVADAFNCAFVNTHAAWADQGAALGYESAGTAHPIDAGHAFIANQLAAVMGV